MAPETAQPAARDTGAKAEGAWRDAPTPRSSPKSRLQYLEALPQALRALGASLELREVVSLLAGAASELLETGAAAVYLLDEARAGAVLRCAASCGIAPERIEIAERPLDGTLDGRVLTERRVFASFDCASLQDPALLETAEREGILSLVCFPIFAAERPVGTLHLYCHECRRFTEDEFFVLQALTDQAAAAIGNASEFGELRLQAVEARAGFQRVGEALAASMDIEETLRLIVQLAVDMSRAEAGAMYLLQSEQEGGNLVLSASRGIDRGALRRFRVRPPSPIARRALVERRAVVVTDTRRRPDTPFPSMVLADGQMEEVRSVVCVPAFAWDRPVGVLEQYSGQPGRFDHSDIQLISGFALHAAVAIENARLYAAEKGAARTLLQAFLPQIPPTLGGFHIGRIFAPGSEVTAVGGDTFDLFTLPDGRIAVLIADVSGQGSLAATLAVLVKYTVRAYALQDPDPARVLAHVNDALVHQTEEGTFVTLCYALIDPAFRSVTVASAAHPPAVHFRAKTGACAPLDVHPGLIAGFLLAERYVDHPVQVESGDVLVFYTDGVLEARRGKDQFGMARLQAVVAENASLPAQEIATALYSAVCDHVEGGLNDDLAVLVLKAS
jgi:Serine phosphatase RsbU, regulator of sigma subunit